MKCTVYYDAWEMECCGTPFGIGDIVNWDISEKSILNMVIDIGHIDYCYDAHSFDSNEILLLTGKVEKIKILYEKYLLNKDSSMYIAVDGKLLDAKYVKGFEEDFEDMEVAGYIVSLSECIIKK